MYIIFLCSVFRCDLVNDHNVTVWKERVQLKYMESDFLRVIDWYQNNKKSAHLTSKLLSAQLYLYKAEEGEEGGRTMQRPLTIFMIYHKVGKILPWNVSTAIAKTCIEPPIVMQVYE